MGSAFEPIDMLTGKVIDPAAGPSLGLSGTGPWISVRNARQIAVDYVWAEGANAGDVTLEHSAVSPFTGVPAVLDSEVFGDDTQAHFTFPGPLMFVRAAIGTTVAGGTTPGLQVILTGIGD